jgi:transmembrane sensor
MSAPRENPAGRDAAIAATAAQWLAERAEGLGPAQERALAQWRRADARHEAAFARLERAQALLERLPFAAEHLADLRAPAATPARRRRWIALAGAGAAAAALIVAAAVWRAQPAPAPAAGTDYATSAGGYERVLLADGSTLELNAESAARVRFSAAERRVELLAGEAHFSVARDPARPFVVAAGGVAVRAVGTAFNVTLQSAAVEVLVTEGVVQLDATATATASARAEPIPLLNPGQRAVVALAPVSPAAAVVVTSASTGEMARALAWQEPLLRLGGATLAELAAGFEARTGRRVVLADPALATLRLGGRFRADDIEGFASLLATTLGIDVERAADGAIVLRKKNPVPR